MIPGNLITTLLHAVLPYKFPEFSFAKYDGDSRTYSSGIRIVDLGTLSVTHGYGSSNNAAGMMQAINDNKWLLREGFNHAVGGSTTLAMIERAKTINIAETGNPAELSTGLSFDGKFSVGSDGVSTVFTQSGNHIFALVSVNDGAGTSSTYYNTPYIASQTLNKLAEYLDSAGLAGKCVYICNELPRGDTYYALEPRTVTGSTCTATNTTNFVDGESFGAVGVVGRFTDAPMFRVLTKVATSPGQNQYSVSSSGVYTFGGIAPTTAWLSYNASPNSPGRVATTESLKIVNAWFNSSDANFTYNGNNYGISGAKYNRPHVRVFDGFNALLYSPDNGTTLLSKPGTLDNLQLHQNMYGAILYAKAAKALIDVDYPDAPSLDARPTRNNWYAARGIGSGTVYSGVLPPSMRVVTPTLVSINGVIKAVVNTETGAITGADITSGSLNFTTGEWTITLRAAYLFALNQQLWFEQDIGDWDGMTNTALSRNLLMNGLLDATPAVGSNLITTTGTSSITGISDAQIPYGWALSDSAFNSAIAAGTVSISVLAETDSNGYPRFVCEIAGTHTAATAVQLLQNHTYQSTKKLTDDSFYIGGQIRYASHSSIGDTYGTTGAQHIATLSNFSVQRNSSTGQKTVTVMSTRTLDGFAGGSGYVDKLALTEMGGAVDLYRVAPLIDVSDISTINSSSKILFQTVANIPFAMRFGVGRVQARFKV